ncbi:MAG: PaaI family thioesterase [Burkholderiaceae bacterium]|jgi:uncharacterized protein (TIGR00369 family)|nr:PaaI family thioesterase [Burkholderiaceae bacterium]
MRRPGEQHAPGFSNPDQALIHAFLARGGQPMPMDANPLARALHCELLEVDRARARIAIEFEPDALFIQGTGVLQGGAVSAMLDFAMAFAVLAQAPLGASCATVTMNTSFQRPAPQGRYRAEGEVERLGKTMAFARAQLFNSDAGTLIASASSSLALF